MTKLISEIMLFLPNHAKNIIAYASILESQRTWYTCIIKHLIKSLSKRAIIGIKPGFSCIYICKVPKVLDEYKGA